MKKALIIFLLTVSCGRETRQEAASGSLSPKQFKHELSTGIVLVDVRTPEEFSSGFIAGAVNIDIKSPDFGRKLDSLDKSQVYFLYCASGVRSDRAADMMREKGFEQVSTLKGGLNAWTEAGLSLD